ncbi:MAG: hypothetical protein ACE5HQ_04085 [Gemmatimonadota bacterium]
MRAHLLRVGSVACLLAQAGCSSGRTRIESSPRDDRPTHAVEYRAVCGARTECRITFLDSLGRERSVRALAQWSYSFPGHSGDRLWLRAAIGGCPPGSVRVSIFVNGRREAEREAGPDGGSACQWVSALAEARIP